jgi:hypothetical protein
MDSTENTSKTDAHIAAFYRALGRANDDMPMPFEVHFQAGGRVMLRYRTVQEVDAAVAHVGGRAGHATHTHREGSERRWHSYGTSYGGGEHATWAGWPVEVWAAVDGPAPGNADIEDQAPRGSDAAEHREPPPAGVDGYTPTGREAQK